jgi:F-type H+-transporting ATPase subunit a
MAEHDTTQASTPQSHETQTPEATLFSGSKWQPTAMAWITLFIILIFCVLGLSRLKKAPRGLQNAWEFTYEWVENVVIQMLGTRGLEYFPLFFCFFLFILFCNLQGLIPGLASATAKIDTTLALATVAIVSTHVLGMKKKGVAAYWGHFFHILDYRKEKGFGKLLTFVLQFTLLPVIELIGELARPLSLTMRLFGNIFAKEILLTILAAMTLHYYFGQTMMDKVLIFMPLILRPAVLILGVLVSVIQAVVFTALAMVYIGGATEVHEKHVSDDVTEAHGAPAGSH